MATTTELDQLAVRAANDPSLSSSGLDRVLIPVILRTRRRWASMSERCIPGERIPPRVDPAGEAIILPES
jgi:hypothetical protein